MSAHLTNEELDAVERGGPGWCGDETFQRLCHMARAALAPAAEPTWGRAINDAMEGAVADRDRLPANHLARGMLDYKISVLLELKQRIHALASPVQPSARFTPTHCHAAGGEYQVVGVLNLHYGPGRWESGIRYRNKVGIEFARTLDDFEARFTPMEHPHDGEALAPSPVQPSAAQVLAPVVAPQESQTAPVPPRAEEPVCNRCGLMGEDIPMCDKVDCDQRDVLYKGSKVHPQAPSEAVARDAARYRFLRDKHDCGDQEWFVYGAKSDNLDEDIDAMLAASPSAGTPEEK